MSIKKPVLCPACGSIMVLRETEVFKTRDNQPKKFYGCSRFPDCKEVHNAHPNGEPLGIPGDKEIRQLRKEVHAIANSIWEWTDKAERRKMYQWLRHNTASGHISKMLKKELIETGAKLIMLKRKIENGLSDS